MGVVEDHKFPVRAAADGVGAGFGKKDGGLRRGEDPVGTQPADPGTGDGGDEITAGGMVEVDARKVLFFQ